MTKTMKLKTLKDIEEDLERISLFGKAKLKKYNKAEIENKFKKTNTSIAYKIRRFRELEEEVRKEAIKWVKDLSIKNIKAGRQTGFNCFGLYERSAQIAILKKFFNITKWDLE